MRAGLLTLLAAVLMPPHGRVNYRCYPVWNGKRTDLEVVWEGRQWPTPWTFNVEVDEDEITARSDAHVQRLWCTDSGVVGRYTLNPVMRYPAQSILLSFAWLRDLTVSDATTLEVRVAQRLLDQTNPFGPGSVLVVGDVLYFTSFHGVDDETFGPPHLSSIRFGPLRAGAAAGELWRFELRGYNVLGVAGQHRWLPYWSPLYPSGHAALTFSFASQEPGPWAADVVLVVDRDAASRQLMFHMPTAAAPLVRSTSREHMTAPGFVCSAAAHDAAPQCCVAHAQGRYTWQGDAATLFGLSFTPLLRAGLLCFFLPQTLWLHYAWSWTHTPGRVLATSGLGSVVAFSGRSFWGVESRADAACASGRALVLANYQLSPVPVERGAQRVACETYQRFEATHHLETPYGAAAVKWLGPWAGDFALFVAQDVLRHEYAQLGARSRAAGAPSVEHVYRLDALRGVVSLQFGDYRRICPWFAEQPRWDARAMALQALFGSTMADNRPCLGLLLHYERVRADARGPGGSTALLAASSNLTALMLVDYGADIEEKRGESGETSLVAMARLGQGVLGHLKRGAAVCTYPLSAFDLRPRPSDEVLLPLVAAAREAPCEPGFWLGDGPNCTALRPCDEGYFCPGHRARTSQRFACPAGTYGPEPAQVAETQCRRCPPERPFSPPASPDLLWCHAEESDARPPQTVHAALASLSEAGEFTFGSDLPPEPAEE